MMCFNTSYVMENLEEAIRLETKTNPVTVQNQAIWCGLKQGMHVLDAGCGPGKTTSILYQMIEPGGSIMGVDYSEERIRHAREQYSRGTEIHFELHDLRNTLDGIGNFDLIWVRFVLEYNRHESLQIVRNLTSCLNPGGTLCLLDLDHNCLNHYELPSRMEKILYQLMGAVELEFNFDPYAGRKLYSYLYDLDYEDIQIDMRSHHLIYGKIDDKDMFNWVKKVEVSSAKKKELFREYPGGHNVFFDDFKRFFTDPRRFTYTPLILCKGRKPA